MSVAQSEEDTPTEGASAQPQKPVSAASRHAARRAAKAAAKAAKRGTAPAMPDELQQKVVEAAGAYERNARTLWAVIAGIVLLAGAAIAVQRLMAMQDHEAGAALAQGVEAAHATIVKAGEEAPEDDDDETYASAEARSKKALDAYRKAATQHAGSAAGRWARLGEGTALAELGKHAEAEKIFSALTKDEDGFIAARATEGTAFALEAQAKHAEAAAQYEALAKLQNGVFKPVADYNRARALMAQGKERDAAGVLEALIKAERGKPESAGTRFPAVVADAETLLTELSVSLGDPKLKAEIPKARSAGGGSGDIMDALRLQMGGEGGTQTLSPELLEALQKQLGGHGNAPAPAPAAP